MANGVLYVGSGNNVYALKSPSSPAFLTSSRLTAKSLCSILSALGTISLSANSSAVCAISKCCSVKSSGVNTSSGVRSSIKKLPPEFLRSVRCRKRGHISPRLNLVQR